MVCVPGREQPARDQVEELCLVRRQPRLLGRNAGRDDRVVVAHLRVVDEARSEWPLARARGELLAIRSGDRAHDARQCRGDRLREVATVGARVGEHLPRLVQTLRDLERAHRAPTENPVRGALKLGQIVQLRRREPPGLRVDGLDARAARARAGDDQLRLFAVRGEPPRALKRLGWRARLRRAEPGSAIDRSLGGRLSLRAEIGDDLEVVLRNERPDRELALDQDGERRRLHATHREQLAARGGATRECVGARQVHAHEPVCSAAAARGVGQSVDFRLAAQAREPRADGVGRERRDPEALDRLRRARRFHSRRFPDVAEDQLALAARVRRADHALDVGVFQDARDDLELAARLVVDDERPVLRDHRQERLPPRAPLGVDLVRLRERDEVSDRPRHHVAVPAQAAVAALARAERAREVARHRRLLRDDGDGHRIAVVIGPQSSSGWNGHESQTHLSHLTEPFARGASRIARRRCAQEPAAPRDPARRRRLFWRSMCSRFAGELGETAAGP